MRKIIHIVRSSVASIVLVVSLMVLSISIRSFTQDMGALVENHEFGVFLLGSLICIGFVINRLAPRTTIPSFVWALFAGVALEPILSHFLHDTNEIKGVMEVFAALVLFAGGLEISFGSFKRWFFPIASLSFIGVFLSAVFFSIVSYLVARSMGHTDDGMLYTVVILGAILASTDPTAIIPTLQTMKFKRPFLKEIAVAESALTDISGSILTRFLLVALVAAPAEATHTVIGQFTPLFQRATYEALSLQIMTGIVVGYLGYALIQYFYARQRQRHPELTETHGDPALLFAVPIFTFALGNIIGGAGFLAAFIAGLLSDVGGQLKRVTHFYDRFLSDLVKPFIFIVLGALVPLHTVLIYAPIGIVVSVLFIVCIRPFVVFISLLPWFIERKFNYQDLLFLSFIRETGIIAAVLLVVSATYSLVIPDFLIAVGMWVIFMTLVIEPPLTRQVAQKLGLLKE